MAVEEVGLGGWQGDKVGRVTQGLEDRISGSDLVSGKWERSSEGHRTGYIAPLRPWIQKGILFLKNKHPALSSCLLAIYYISPLPAIQAYTVGPRSLSQGWLLVPPLGGVLPSLCASGLLGTWQKVVVRVIATISPNFKDPIMSSAHLQVFPVGLGDKPSNMWASFCVLVWS